MSAQIAWVNIYKLKIPCPVCGKRDNCAISDDRRLAYCRREPGQFQGRDGGWLHVLMERSPEQVPHPQRSEVRGRRPLEITLAEKPQNGERVVPEERAQPDHLHAVYSALLSTLSLDAKHQAALRSRGLSDETIARNGYKSVPMINDNVVRRINAALPDNLTLDYVPGFYLNNTERVFRARGLWWAGILIPVHDSRGRIIALSVRRDTATAESGDKYVWLSSANFPQGASPGAPPHFARPQLETPELLLTEGALKADVIAELSKCSVCGIAGVTQWPKDSFGFKLKRTFPELRRVTVCFDADFRTNRQVHRQLVQLTRHLKRCGLNPTIRTWPLALAKGYDDYLLSQIRQEGASKRA